MTKVEKRATVGLVVCAVLVVVLAIWFYTRIDGLQIKVKSLETEVDNLRSDRANLESQVSDLEDQVDSLSEPQLHLVNLDWSDHHPGYGSPWIAVSGSVFNSGTYSAYNVVLTVEIYDDTDKMLKTEELDIGTIEGKTYQSFDESVIGYLGDAYLITTSLTFSSIPDARTQELRP